MSPPHAFLPRDCTWAEQGVAATHTFSSFFRIEHPFLGTAPDRCNLRLEVRGAHPNRSSYDHLEEKVTSFGQCKACSLALTTTFETFAGHLMHLVFVDFSFLLDICLVLQSYSWVRGFIEKVAVVSSQCRCDSIFLSYAQLLVDRFVLGFFIFAAFEKVFMVSVMRGRQLCPDVFNSVSLNEKVY